MERAAVGEGNVGKKHKPVALELADGHRLGGETHRSRRLLLELQKPSGAGALGGVGVFERDPVAGAGEPGAVRLCGGERNLRMTFPVVAIGHFPEIGRIRGRCRRKNGKCNKLHRFHSPFLLLSSLTVR